VTEPLKLADGVSIVVSVAVLVAVENSATGAFRESLQDQFVSWSEWQDLNLRPPRPERGDNAPQHDRHKQKDRQRGGPSGIR